ncbi:MAG: hypothetical protein GF392_00685 [Candidatus Omnitrophica bacterium]|nr:hypothetical protein [Candidatus Omnitrophota bacterium]
MAEVKKYFRKKDSDRFYETVFRLLQGYLGTRAGIAPGGITEQKAGVLLANRIKDPAVLDNIRKIYSECYLARYAKIYTGKKDMLVTFKALQQLIKKLDSEEEI